MYATGAAPRSVRRALDAAFADRPDVLVTDRDGLIERITRDFAIGLSALSALFGVAILVAVLGMINTLALSVTEPTRELGLLRAVGATRRQIRRTVRTESVVIAAYGGLLGAGTGILVGGVLQHLFTSQSLTRTTILSPMVDFALAAMVVVGVLAAVWPARRAARADVLVAVATEWWAGKPGATGVHRWGTITRVTDVLDDLQWRGLIALSTDLDALRAELSRGPITYYCGFDPTAPSLHFGHLTQVLTVRRLQLAGNLPLALVGGATGLIGDPRPESERTLNSRETVAGWVDRIRAQIEPLLDFDGRYAARMVNNLDWTEGLSALDFLRDIGKHFRVNKMIAKDAVSARLNSEAGISYTEFSYQILQGMDFLELFRRHSCRLQTGGSDQWGNLTAGTDLIHKVTGESVHLLATPLVTDSNGQKIGKSTGGGSVWLDPEMTSPYAFYQYLINVEDALVPQFLRMFTFLDREEIVALEKETADRPAARSGQRRLAEEITKLVHGEAETRQVIAASQALFGRGDLGGLPPATLRAALTEAGLTEIRGEVPPATELFRVSGLASSRGDARRTIAEGGAYINNERVSDPEAVVPEDALLHGRWLVLRRGKKTVAGVELVR